MKTIVIVGGTREAAYQRLKRIASGDGIVRRDFYDEAEIDGNRILAMGGSEDDVCWLVGLGFCIKRIITVEPNGISEKMGKRINHVRSAEEARQ